ncbi:alpha/beta hydrolase [Actinoplanes sp. NPDC051513]|uniref:alpha/beta hydrolase n=1 Tax=Actinoplanes sp. NPDC051513 TaxID=3363908 RepID=UPI0037A11008
MNGRTRFGSAATDVLESLTRVGQGLPIDRAPGEPLYPAAARPRAAFRRTRLVRRAPGLAGFAVAVVFYCLSLTPSLLPRPWLMQGVVSGLTAAMGYAAGATLGALAGRFWQPPRKLTRVAWTALIVVTPPLGLLFLALGTGWQQELRVRLGMERMETYDIVRIVGVSVLTFALILLIARLLRLATRRLARFLGRFVPKPVAYAAGLVVVVYLVVGFTQDFLVSNAVAVANEAASLTNGSTSPGIVAPASGKLSGSPASLVPWHSLGRQGREFAATAPSRTDLGRFAGRAAADPIRVYVGLDSAATVGERVRLAVREMDRAGAFDRAVVAVITATGTGWVDGNVTSALEYMYAGDTAMVSMQYSYLPSWLSLMVDQSKVTETASLLIAAVHARWAALPAASRPKLVLFGESLGSYGTEKSFQSLRSMADGADGALLVGPPFVNPIWRPLVDGRDRGSPVWSPVYQNDDTVRFSQRPAELRTSVGRPPKVLYLQNSSDPIVWWGPELLIQPPDWLDHPRGPDVSPDMHWYPGITFWQTVVDITFANNVPTGHGHVYGSGVADGWAALLPPPGWSAQDTERLRALLDAAPRR